MSKLCLQQQTGEMRSHYFEQVPTCFHLQQKCFNKFLIYSYYTGDQGIWGVNRLTLQLTWAYCEIPGDIAVRKDFLCQFYGFQRGDQDTRVGEDTIPMVFLLTTTIYTKSEFSQVNLQGFPGDILFQNPSTVYNRWVYL